jgi:hypothetical protein
VNPEFVCKTGKNCLLHPDYSGQGKVCPDWGRKSHT